MDATQSAPKLEGLKSSARIKRERETTSDDSSIAHEAERVKRTRPSTQSDAPSSAVMCRTQEPRDAYEKLTLLGLPGGKTSVAYPKRSAMQ